MSADLQSPAFTNETAAREAIEAVLWPHGPVCRQKEDMPKRRGFAHKHAVLSLVERGGKVRSFHVAGTTAAHLVPILRANIAKETAVMTDEAGQYAHLGKEFASHVCRERTLVRARGIGHARRVTLGDIGLDIAVRPANSKKRYGLICISVS